MDAGRIFDMPIVQVPALKALMYQGHSYVRGELITCEAAEALMLARRGDVTLTKGASLETRDLTAETSDDPPMRRRRYARRDLTAEE